MTTTETVAILCAFNEWRRGDYEPSEQPEPPDPCKISEAIDAAIEMIERLEATERSDAESIAMYRRARDERDALRAELMEQCRLLGMSAEREAKHLAQIAALEKERDALRTALDALRGKAIDRSVDNAFARFAGVFGKGPDAPYPGMIEAFENHYGQDFRDKDWRKEAACWAASWHRAVHRPAPASVPDGVMRERVMEAIAEALGDGAYDCTRVWSAWGYGTMGSDDFRLIANDPARLDEIAEAAIQAVFAAAPKPEVK